MTEPAIDLAARSEALDRQSEAVRTAVDSAVSDGGLEGDILGAVMKALSSVSGLIADVGALVAREGAALAEAKAAPASVLSQDQWAVLMKAVRVELRQAMRDASGDMIRASRLRYMAFGGVAGWVLIWIGVLIGLWWR